MKKFTKKQWIKFSIAAVLYTLFAIWMQNVWMITGASGGLGKGIAEAALRRGDAVALTSRSPAKLNALAAEFPKQAMTVKLELDRIGSMEKALHQVYARFGRIDVLVNNAGHGYRAAIEESEPTQVRELFETDFFAPMRLIQLALPGMRARHSGMISLAIRPKAERSSSILRCAKMRRCG